MDKEGTPNSCIFATELGEGDFCCIIENDMLV